MTGSQEVVGSNPVFSTAWKQALLIIDFQGNTRIGSSTSLSVADS